MKVRIPPAGPGRRTAHGMVGRRRVPGTAAMCVPFSRSIISPSHPAPCTCSWILVQGGGCQSTDKTVKGGLLAVYHGAKHPAPPPLVLSEGQRCIFPTDVSNSIFRHMARPVWTPSSPSHLALRHRNEPAAGDGITLSLQHPPYVRRPLAGVGEHDELSQQGILQVQVYVPQSLYE